LSAKGENLLPAIKSLQDLKQIRATASEKQASKRSSGDIQVIVGMGTCGIAAGANDTLKAILKQIQNEQLGGITVSKTGCIGLCEAEPIVEIIIGEKPKVSYGHVTPEVAHQILKEHVEGGKIVLDHLIKV
jgi:NADP-reducing hydrogenase subunit HndB